jgi:hypothetical protein
MLAGLPTSPEVFNIEHSASIVVPKERHGTGFGLR